MPGDNMNPPASWYEPPEEASYSTGALDDIYELADEARFLLEGILDANSPYDLLEEVRQLIVEAKHLAS